MELLEMMNKDYLVITTNVDHCFQKAGFDKQRLFYTQGDDGLFQCSESCHIAAYDNEQLVNQMLREQKDMRIPSELLPRCPRCGKLMTMNLRSDDKFAEDEAAIIALREVRQYFENGGRCNVIFNGFGDNDRVIYERLLQRGES